MVKINFLQFSPDLSNFLQLKPFLFAGEDFLNFILRICQPWGWVLVPTKIGSAQVLSALTLDFRLVLGEGGVLEIV